MRGRFDNSNLLAFIEFIKSIYAFTCGFPQSYQTTLKILGDTFETLGMCITTISENTEYNALPTIGNKFETEGFAFAIRRNILFGGDNCGRSFLLGGLLTAAGAQVPREWEERTQSLEGMKLEHLERSQVSH